MPAGYCDVCADATEVVGDLASHNIYFGGTPVDIGEVPLFTRAVSGLSTQFAIAKGDATGHAYLATAGGATFDFGVSIGDHSVAVLVLNGALLAFKVKDATHYTTRTFDASLTPLAAAVDHAIPATYQGTTHGVTNLAADGSPVWTDAVSPGVYRGVPMSAPSLAADGTYVGIATVDSGLPPQIVGVTAATQVFTVALGSAAPPHAVLGDDKVLRVALYTGAGLSVFLAFPPYPAVIGTVDGHTANRRPNSYVSNRQAIVDKDGRFTDYGLKLINQLAGNGVNIPGGGR